MPILVLQTFARQRGSAGRAAHEESLPARVGEGPDKVAHALESEHGVIGEEGNHLHLIVRVRRAGRGERRHGARFRDALLQNLTVLRLAVVQDHVLIVRLVKLPLAGVNSHLPDDRLHAERAALVGNNRHDELADLRILEQMPQNTDKRHGGGDAAALRARQRFRIILERRRFELRCRNLPQRHVSAQLPAALLQIADLGAVVGRPVERPVVSGLLGNRNLEPRAEGGQSFVTELFFLMRRVARLRRAQAIPLHGLGQNDGGPALVLYGALVGVIHLLRIVATAVQPVNVVVAHIGDQLQQLGIPAEKFFADVGATLGFEILILAVHALFHALEEQAGSIEGQQAVPVGAPDHLDHVPAGPAEGRFQLVDDFSVAAHRAVQALQIAIDDEDQVVQLLAGSQRQRPHRLRFVGLAIADERPDLARRGGDDFPILQVAHEAGLVDGVEGSDSHRDRREAPEIRHEPGVRVGRQSGAIAQLMAKILQALLAEPAFEERPRVDAGGGMALKIDEIARPIAIGGVEEVVESHFEQRRQRGVGRNVAADTRILLVLAMHHGHGIPADQALDATLEAAIARVGRFFFHRYGIEVGRIQLDGDIHARLSGPPGKGFEKLRPTAGACLVHYLVKSLNPLGNFLGIRIYRNGKFLMHEPIFIIRVQGFAKRAPRELRAIRVGAGLEG